MEKIVTVKDLDSIIASSTKKFSSKLDGKNKKVTLFSIFMVGAESLNDLYHLFLLK